jgi:predicted dehydrogenase
MVRIGIIGAGPNATEHARYYRDSSRSQLIAIADPDRGRAETLANETGAEAVADFREFLDNVDAIVVSSPNYLHREHAIACAEAGRHVFCEKPMGLSIVEAREIADAVNRAKVKSCVGFTVRFDGPFQTMQRMAKAGELGPIVSLCSRRAMYIDPASFGWRSDHELSGGLLYEINIHELDWMMAIGGPVESVFARTWTAGDQGPRGNDHLWVTLNFAEGPVGIHEGGWLASNANFYRNIQGTEAGLATNEWGNDLYLSKNKEPRTKIEPDLAFDLRGHFLDCIEHDAAPVSDVNWALKVMAVSEAVLESAQTCRVVPMSAEVPV